MWRRFNIPHDVPFGLRSTRRQFSLPYFNFRFVCGLQEELDEVADVSFRYDPVMEGKRIVGWDFVPVPDKPKEKDPEPSVRESAARASSTRAH